MEGRKSLDWVSFLRTLLATAPLALMTTARRPSVASCGVALSYPGKTIRGA